MTAAGGAAALRPGCARRVRGLLLRGVLRQEGHALRLPGPGQGSDHQYRQAGRTGRGRAEGAGDGSPEQARPGCPAPARVGRSNPTDESAGRRRDHPPDPGARPWRNP
ncbi:hypothetical protein GCM10009639_44420 [Kitasatospora putterlickiae]|uniref:Uncharacterized protein n=1 Tax=Kitasatospora putterlickiae TaxID=221725 RepID=A0ABP4J0N3_9ACTN